MRVSGHAECPQGHRYQSRYRIGATIVGLFVAEKLSQNRTAEKKKL
jgi:hypothetical protein